MRSTLLIPTFFLVITVCALIVIPGTSFGAGFAIIEQSVSGLGNAFAGGAASAEDATTVFFNPAGMSVLEGTEFIVGGHVIIPSAEFRNKDSTHITGGPLQGNNGNDAGTMVFVPNLYFTTRLGDRFGLGLGINAPFGLETDYDNDWVGRYHALKSELITVNINPSVSYRVNRHLSVGVGLNAQYLDATLSNAIDFGTMDALGIFAPIPAGALGLTPQQSDGNIELAGDSWGYGYNLGILIEFSENSRIGLAYRSSIEHDIEGSADFDTPAALAPVQTATGYFTDSDAESTVDLPETFSLSYYQRFGAWATMADVTWTKWSVFDELRFKFDNGQPDGVTTTDWDESYRYALGISYYPSDQWTFRSGIAYDETPIPDAQHRTPRIPTEDRWWVALGLGYNVNQRIGFDIGYAHLFVDDPEIDKDPVGEDLLRGGLKGSYDGSVDIISAQLNIAF